MKKPLFVIFSALVACALLLYACLYTPSYLKEKERNSHLVPATLMVSSERDMGFRFESRMARKNAELKRLGITGEKRQRLIEQEAKAAMEEINRVRASHYKSPFNEKTLPIEPK